MGQPSITNNFHEDLRYSLDSSLEDFWEAIYHKAFHNLEHIEVCDNLELQKQGVDKVIYLSNGNVLYIDEKCRRKVYRDIALETVSNTYTGAAGWINKDLQMDYLAYAFMPIKRAYLFSWPMLRKAWIENREEWQEKYRPIIAPNNGYTTISVPVPIKKLLIAVVNASVIQL